MPDLFITHPLILLLIPLFILASRFLTRPNRSYLIPHLSSLASSQEKKEWITPTLKWTMILSAIFALSNPATTKTLTSTLPNSRDIVLAVDTSGSMSLGGFNPTDSTQSRLDVVKEVLIQFIQQRKQDRIGIVVFGDKSSIATPLNFESDAQQEIIRSLKVGMLGKSTAIIDALVQAEQLLIPTKSKSKIIILLSDGEDEMSRVPLSFALSYAKKHQIKIYTILIDKSDSNLMKVVARKSQTTPYTAKDKTSLLGIYHDINALEKSNAISINTRIQESLFQPFVLLSLLAGLGLLWRGYRQGLS